jgi:hypothetical protein
MKVWIKVLLVCMALAPHNLYAVEVERLYEVEVIAKSEQEPDRVEAIQQAMRRVLMRTLAGNNVFQDKTVNNVLENATNYVKESQYSLAETAHNQARLMRVLFEEEKLVAALRKGNIGLWNEIRPTTLVWLVVEQDGVKQFFDSDEMPEIEWVLKKTAKQKKIPVLFPMQDLTEKRVLSIGDVLSAYSEHLLEVSVRYEVVSTLAGKLVKQGMCWKAEWTLYFDAKIEQWRSPCSSIDQAILTGYQGVYDQLSQYYAAKPEKKELEPIVMKVSGITRGIELMQLTNYLNTLPMIKTVTWETAEDGYNVYRLFYQGERETLNDLLISGGILKAESASNYNAEEARYQFLLN